MATLEEEYQKYRGANGVNAMYDAQAENINRGYDERANDLAVQYERSRRNLNQQAAANGLNTGAGSQMQLALGNNYNRNYGNLQASRQQALSNNDYLRNQAMLAEYKQEYQDKLNQAKTLASYGDFSGYAAIPGYSEDQIAGMRSAWIAQNPQLAYGTGAIGADEYYRLTGKYPAGYEVPGSGYGYYGGGSSGSGSGVGPGNVDPLSPKYLAAKAAADAAQERGRRTTEYYGAGPVRQMAQSVSKALTSNLSADAYLDYMVRTGQISKAEADAARGR